MSSVFRQLVLATRRWVRHSRIAPQALSSAPETPAPPLLRESNFAATAASVADFLAHGKRG